MTEIKAENAAAAALIERVAELRKIAIERAAPMIAEYSAAAGRPDPTLDNLAHYLAIRHHDLRDLQRELMWHGLSSLGRLEGRVLPTLDAVQHALSALAGMPSTVTVPSKAEFFDGEARLAQATDRLFGTPPDHRHARIMVTLPGDAFNDPELIESLVEHGMDIARINCAHDSPEIWRSLALLVRQAGKLVGRNVSVLMDIAGPKIRTENVAVEKKARKLDVGDHFRLVAEGEPRVTKQVLFAALVSLPELVNRLNVGDRVRYDDGKLEGIVDSRTPGEAIIRVTRAKAGGVRMKPEKGLNFPDTVLGLSPLTAKDRSDIRAVIECADMIGYSFVSRTEDIDRLEEVLAEHGAGDKPLGLVAKIEQPEAIRNLPGLIARAGRNRPFGVMIARGDLAAEIGFERLAEMQEEIMWICEAASVPVIWATQVLETLVKNGVPSRGEMTDAAMAARAECVMLNKGPAIVEAVELLDRLLERMDGHVFKKTPTMRALRSW